MLTVVASLLRYENELRHARNLSEAQRQKLWRQRIGKHQGSSRTTPLANVRLDSLAAAWRGPASNPMAEDEAARAPTLGY